MPDDLAAQVRAIWAKIGRSKRRPTKAEMKVLNARSEEMTRQRAPLTEQEIREIWGDEKYARIQNRSW